MLLFVGHSVSESDAKTSSTDLSMPIPVRENDILLRKGEVSVAMKSRQFERIIRERERERERERWN